MSAGEGGGGVLRGVNEVKEREEEKVEEKERERER